MRIDVQTNFPEIARALRDMREDVARVVTGRSLNRTIDIGKSAANRAIRQEFAVQAAWVRERLRVTKARFSGGAIRLEAILAGTHIGKQRRGANVIAFGARRVKDGVSVKIKRAGPRRVIKDAFIGNKGRTVFVRVPGTKMPSRQQYRGKHAERIKAVSTIDLPQMFNARKINRIIIRTLQDRFPEVFARELRFALDKFHRGRR